MGKYAYVNGEYINHNIAVISIDDRGLQFGDAVYEVFSLFNGKAVDADAHYDRLERSLNQLGMDLPYTRGVFNIIVKKLISINKIKTGLVYFQVSRGTASRDHCIPTTPMLSNVIITTKKMKINGECSKPIKVVSKDDNRWGRVDIKTVMLLPNCIAKTEALAVGAEEIIFVKDGIVTESASSNFFYVDKNGDLVTSCEGGILMGITRQALIVCAKNLQINIIEKEFRLEDAINAGEAFVSSASRFLTPISHIDNNQLGDGYNYNTCKVLYEQYVKDFC